MSIDTIVLFDGPERDNLLPLTFTRAVADLRIGILTILEKWEKLTGIKTQVLTQSYLQSKYPFSPKGKTVYINAAILPSQKLLAEIEKLPLHSVLRSKDSIVAIFTDESFQTLSNLEQADTSNFELRTSNFTGLRFPWDIFTYNGSQIRADIVFMKLEPNPEVLSASNHLVAPDNIYVAANVSCGFSILNAKAGPIYLGKGCEVMEGNIIRGPFSLGDYSTVKMGARIYGDTSIGPQCKVSGEIINSVIFGYSNKAHDGFLGNSVIGEWCNLGADTNNSNLKNNYGQVKAWNYPAAGQIDTGLQFCGLIMGDHSKCSINTMFNTGTVVGVSANIFGGGFPSKFVPDFSWGEKAEYQLDKAFEVAELVMDRRGISLAETDKEILRNVFEITKKYRKT
jgi:UDP-N-acetylglucosamine diphosphorylase/glucosamine-1-phosphate N-acetyltransferase